MASKQILKVLRVFKLTAGSTLSQAVSASTPADGARWKVEAATDFSSGNGGTARIYTPATYDPENSATYEDIEYADIDEETDELLGVVRTSPKSWTSGIAFVQEGIEPTVEKWADGKLDDEEEIRSVPVPAALYPLLHLGAYDEETAPGIPVVYEEDDDQLFVSDAPVGAVPKFDEDLEVLPPVGGGDASGATTDPDTGKVLPPKGMGFEDGVAPGSSPTPEVFGGIGNTIFVRWVTIANSSIVTYEVHCHTTASFTPAADTLVHSAPYSGTAGFKAMHSLKDFPLGHVLDGTASDPPQPGTTYRFKIIAKDGSGEAAASAEVTGTPSLIPTTALTGTITSTQITDLSVTTPKLAANAVTAAKIAANTITATEIAADAITTSELAANAVTATEISAGAVTATKISVSDLAAIDADLGNIIAGTITGVTITGGTIRTASTGKRVQMSSGVVDTILWFNSSNVQAASIAAGSDTVMYIGAAGALSLEAFSGDILLWSTGAVRVQDGPLVIGSINDPLNFLEMRTVSGTIPAIPAASHCRIWYDAGSVPNRLRARNPDSIQTLCTF